MALLETLFEKLSRPPEQIRAENLRQWVASIPGASTITDCECRQRARVAGVIQNVRIDPRGGGSIEATIIDGTGRIIARWLGRHSLAGIRLGMGVIMEGTAGEASDGSLVILNPDYELVPGPEHG